MFVSDHQMEGSMAKSRLIKGIDPGLVVKPHPGFMIPFARMEQGSCSKSAPRRQKSLEQGDFILQGIFQIAKREEQEWRLKQAEEIKALLFRNQHHGA
jgi:hypothetical protein